MAIFLENFLTCMNNASDIYFTVKSWSHCYVPNKAQFTTKITIKTPCEKNDNVLLGRRYF